MATCPKCGKEFLDGGFCPYDGAELSADQRDQERKYEAMLGTLIDGRYRIEAKLGDGGMGVVFLARHSVIEKLFALKILKDDIGDPETVAQRFVQEARAASRIRHPNVVDVTDFGSSPEGVSYQVMEYLEGETLAKVIKRHGVLPIPRALNIVAQIARALSAAHKTGVVHRDLKPENVFLIEREERADFVKIVDFGIAKLQPRDGATMAPRLTQVGTVFGTPEYMAPEQASGRADVDLRADIYSLGCLTFELLTGQVPIKGESMVKTVAMQILDEIPSMRSINPRVDVSENLENAILKALAKRPNDRYPTMDAFLDALADATSEGELNLPLVVSREQAAVEAEDFDARNDFVHTAEWVPTPRTRTRAPGAYSAILPTATTGGEDAQASAAQPAIIHSPLPYRTERFDEQRSRPVWVYALGTACALALALGAIAYAMYEGKETRGQRSEVATVATPKDAGVETVGDLKLKEAPRGLNPEIADASTPTKTPPTQKRTTEKRHAENRHPPKSPTRPQTKALTHVPGHGKPVSITVYSSPQGASLYVDEKYFGQASAGVTSRMAEGTKLRYRCDMPGFESGYVNVTYSEAAIFTCTLKRKRVCLDETKNPYDECGDGDGKQ